MRASRKNRLRADLSAIESVGITFAITAEVLFRVGDNLYRSASVPQMALFLLKAMAVVLGVAFVFSCVSAAFCALLVRALGYRRVDRPVAFVFISGIHAMFNSLMAFLPQACLFAGLALLGLHVSSIIIFAATLLIFILVSVILGSARGKKVGASRREALASLAISLAVMLIGLPIVLMNGAVPALLISLALAIIVRIVVWRVVTLNDEINTNQAE